MCMIKYTGAKNPWKVFWMNLEFKLSKLEKLMFLNSIRAKNFVYFYLNFVKKIDEEYLEYLEYLKLAWPTFSMRLTWPTFSMRLARPTFSMRLPYLGQLSLPFLGHPLLFLRWQVSHALLVEWVLILWTSGNVCRLIKVFIWNREWYIFYDKISNKIWPFLILCIKYRGLLTTAGKIQENCWPYWLSDSICTCTHSRTASKMTVTRVYFRRLPALTKPLFKYQIFTWVF